MSIPFNEIASALRADVEGFCRRYLSAGKRVGSEWCVGNVFNDPGESLKVSLTKACWKDFSSDEGGSDLISLYAAIHNLPQGEAAKACAQLVGIQAGSAAPAATPRAATPPAPKRRVIVPVPPQVPSPGFKHFKHGDASQHWHYRDGQGRTLGYVVRYDTGPEQKEVLPLTYAETGDGARWSFGQWSDPRPLYGLWRLAERPNAWVLVVEGEKCAEAADKLAPFYVAISWPAGSKAWQKCAWEPLRGRRVVLMPDNDAPGIEAMNGIAGRLRELGVAELKIIDPATLESGEPAPAGYDIADMLRDGWDVDRFYAWAKPRARVLSVVPIQPIATSPVAPVTQLSGPPAERAPSKVTSLAAAREAAALKQQPDDMPIPSVHELWKELGLDLQGNGRPMANENNVNLILSQRKEYDQLIWYDSFLQRYLTNRDYTGCVTDKLYEWKDSAHTTWLTIALQRTYGIQKMTVNAVQRAVIAQARNWERNELREWLAGLRWDGTKRLDSFFADIFGTPDDEYHRAAGRNFWISMVARATRAPVKVDNMIVLEGAQGVGKSTALRIIGGTYFTEAHENVTSKDFYIALQGKLVIEIGEMDAFTRAEVQKVKAVISNQTDRYRAPYDATAQDWPRQCVFAGTTNRDDWHRDETGGRRFWPIRCGEINLEALRAARDQMFAEALAALESGGSWWEMPDAVTKAEQEARRQRDEWETPIADYAHGKAFVLVLSVLTECLKFDINEIDQSNQNRVSRALTAIGWRKKTVRVGHKTFKAYVPPASA